MEETHGPVETLHCGGTWGVGTAVPSVKLCHLTQGSTWFWEAAFWRREASEFSIHNLQKKFCSYWCNLKVNNWGWTMSLLPPRALLPCPACLPICNLRPTCRANVPDVHKLMTRTAGELNHQVNLECFNWLKSESKPELKGTSFKMPSTSQYP